MIFEDNYKQEKVGENLQTIQNNSIKATALISYAVIKKVAEIAQKYAEKNGKFKLPFLNKKNEELKDKNSQKNTSGINKKIESKRIIGGFYNSEISEFKKYKKPIPEDYKNAMNLQKSANLILNKYGKLEGKNLIADGKDYRIMVHEFTVNDEEKKSLTIDYKPDNVRILSANFEKSIYKFSPEDVSRLKEIAKKIEQEQKQKQDLER